MKRILAVLILLVSITFVGFAMKQAVTGGGGHAWLVVDGFPPTIPPGGSHVWMAKWWPSTANSSGWREITEDCRLGLKTNASGRRETRSEPR